ncbi:hypothetical protein [Kitasatospora sp. NPDC127116]|uniref:hypothetical protein n=1 Tax=Kitasatospora sp. NPDC127116 TaxID=3345367 RepID=UPI0036302511
MKEQGSEELEAEVTLLRRCHDAYAGARDRLKAAGERAATAEVTRRAAIREMGQILTEHREERATYPPDERRHWRIDMEDAQTLTGLSRRTLSEAVGAASTAVPTDRDFQTWSDRALAAHCRAYGSMSHDAPIVELHRRHPRLAGFNAAIKALQDVDFRRSTAANPDWFDMTANDDFGEPSADLQLLQSLYRQYIDAVADGRAPAL